MEGPENDILADLAGMLEERLARLEALAGCTAGQYLADADLQLRVERLLETAIQAAIDIAFRIISLRGLERPGNYHEAMEALARERLLAEEPLARMKELVGLRNALVHTYRKLRHPEVHRHLQSAPAILRAYVRAAVGPHAPDP